MPRVQARCGELPALSTVQNPKGDTEKSWDRHDFDRQQKHAQVIWQEDEEGTPEKAILVTNYECGGLDRD